MGVDNYVGARIPVDIPRITLRFGATYPEPYYRPDKPHRGVDFAPFPGSQGERVYASFGGTVSKAGWDNRAGHFVEMKISFPFTVWAKNLSGRVQTIPANEKLTARYLHFMKAPNVSEGQFVPVGSVVGFIGSSGLSSGPHLHFEIFRRDRSDANTLDPVDILTATVVGAAPQFIYAVGS